MIQLPIHNRKFSFLLFVPLILLVPFALLALLVPLALLVLPEPLLVLLVGLHGIWLALLVQLVRLRGAWLALLGLPELLLVRQARLVLLDPPVLRELLLVLVLGREESWWQRCVTVTCPSGAA